MVEIRATPEREHTCKDDPNCRVLFEAGSFGDRSNAQGSQDSCDQPPPKERSPGPRPHDVSNGHPWQNSMGKCITEKGHAAQHDIGPYQSADNADHHSCQRSHAA